MEIQSITSGPSKRETRFELLRIVAMLMVLTVHADFYSLGGVDFNSEPFVAWFRTIMEFSAIISVNLFIMISGWFHIRPTVRGFCNFIFQCLFFLTLVYFSSIFFGITDFSLKGIVQNYVFSVNWFIISYVILYFLSPIINAYLNTTAPQKILCLTIMLTTIDATLGWCSIAPWYSKGYSPLTFLNLYLIGHTLRIYKSTRYKWGGVFFIVATILNSSLFYLQTRGWIIVPHPLSYDAPLVLIQTIAFFAWFSTLKIKHNPTINFIASSAFAVYLLHINNGFFNPVFKALNKHIYNSFDGIICFGLIAAFCMSVFIGAIILDQPRKWIWRHISRRIPKKEF